MKKIVVLLIVLMLYSNLLSAGSSSSQKDLVAIGIKYAKHLEQNELPYTWRSAGYLLAEWNQEQQMKAVQSSIRFEVLLTAVTEQHTLFIFEVRNNQKPIMGLDNHILYHQGKEVLLNITSRQADELTKKGYRGIHVPHIQRAMRENQIAIPYECTHHPLIEELLSRTSQTQWLDWIEKITGVESVDIGGTTYSITTRHSDALFNGNLKGRAYPFALQQAQYWHYGDNIEEDSYLYGGQTWKNLVLTLPGEGTSKDLVLMVGHYDTMSDQATTNAPGADDNSSGSATLFEAARLLRQFRFDRTIKLIFFTGEEQWLQGSAAYVNDHSTTNMLGVINLDMFGWDGDNDRCFQMEVGTIVSSQDVGHCVEDSINAYSLNLPHDFVITNASPAGDHASFWDVGVGAVNLFENGDNDNLPGGCVGGDFNPYYHTIDDNLSTMTVSYAYDIGRAGLASIAAMAIPIESCFSEVPVLTTNTSSALQVKVNWTTLTDANTYRVYRSAQGCEGQWIEMAEVAGNEWIDLNVTPGTTYYYYVEGVAADGFCVSDMSNCETAVPVNGPHASYHDSIIMDYCQETPGDGTIDPGERIVVNTGITNDGLADLTAVSGILTSTTSGITIADGSAAFPDVMQGQTVSSDPPHFTYVVEKDFPCGELADFSMALAYEQGNNITLFSHQVGKLGTPTTIINQDWETGGTGWNMTGLWHITDEASQDCFTEPYPSSTHVAYFGQDGSCDYSNGHPNQGDLTSPVFPGVTAFSELQFQYWREVAPGDGYHDQTVVYAMPDGGVWTQIWYKDGDDPANLAWTPSGAISLSAFAGLPIKLRFHFNTFDDLYNNFDGWAIDDITVTASDWQCTPCTVSVPDLKPYNNAKPAVDDSNSPHANGIIEPDESVNLLSTLENSGSATATTVVGTLTTTDPITIEQEQATFPDIGIGNHAVCYSCYRINAPLANRPATHWDFNVSEHISADTFGPVSFAYTYHVGESFADVPVTHTFYASIETLLHTGITSGCTSSNYCPDNTVSREQAAKFICLSMNHAEQGSCVPASCAGLFGDVPASDPFCPYIEALYNAGIVNGCTANPLLYCPLNGIQRQAMAKLICLSMELTQPGSCTTAPCTGIFADMPASNPFCSYAEALYNSGTISGCSASPLLYCPNNPVQRNQMAKFIVNAFGFTL